MTKDETIDKLWESSNHGTRREDVESAYNAGSAAEREKASAVIVELLSHIEGSHHINQHNPYTARELWPDIFAAADEYLRSNAGGEATGAALCDRSPRP
jgi:hypothetical protein